MSLPGLCWSPNVSPAPLLLPVQGTPSHHQPPCLIFALKAHCSRSPLAGLFECHLQTGHLGAGRRGLVLKTELTQGPQAPCWTRLPSRNHFGLIYSHHDQEICTKYLCGRRGRRWREGSEAGAPTFGAQYDETGSRGKSVTSHLPWDTAIAVTAEDAASETPTQSSFPPCSIAGISSAGRSRRLANCRSLTDPRPLSDSTQVENAHFIRVSQCALRDTEL